MLNTSKMLIFAPVINYVVTIESKQGAVIRRKYKQNMSIKQISIVKIPSATETLKNMPVGEKQLCTHTMMTLSSVRMAATRLKKDGYEYEVTVDPLSPRYYIKRLR